MINNEVFEIIRILAKRSGLEKSVRQLTSYHNGNAHTLWGIRYLLSQVLRQYVIPKERVYVSENAKTLWKDLGIKEDIKNFSWKDILPCEGENIKVKIYKGASKEPTDEVNSLEKNIEFRSLFHDEHIIPIKTIITRLEALALNDQLTDDNIEKILNDICICKITKKEDRDINQKYKRPDDILDCYKEVYKSRGIIIRELEEKIKL